MNKIELYLVCPSCKITEIKFEKKKYFCEKCELSYIVKNNLPILINFNLENVLIKENEIIFKKERLDKNIFKEKILNFVYGTSVVTEDNVIKFLNKLDKDNNKRVLVIGGASKGSGTDDLWKSEKVNITSIDLVGTKNVDYIVDAHYLPFKNETFDAIWIQAVLEHVVSPEVVVKEIFRVLKEGGVVYSETPFMQQIHMGKNDFTRYTASGHRYLFRSFEKIDVGINGGPGVTLAWSIKYFIWSLSNEKIANYFSIIPFFFLRMFDKILSEKASWDSSSGFYFLGKKNTNYEFDKEELNQLYKGNQI